MSKRKLVLFLQGRVTEVVIVDLAGLMLPIGIAFSLPPVYHCT